MKVYKLLFVLLISIWVKFLFADAASARTLNKVTFSSDFKTFREKISDKTRESFKVMIKNPKTFLDHFKKLHLTPFHHIVTEQKVFLGESTFFEETIIAYIERKIRNYTPRSKKRRIYQAIKNKLLFNWDAIVTVAVESCLLKKTVLFDGKALIQLVRNKKIDQRVFNVICNSHKRRKKG